MSVLEMITRIHSSMVEPEAYRHAESGNGSARFADWDDESMSRVISLFSNPDGQAQASAGEDSLPASSKEPEYFRHLMAYLRQRKAEEQRADSQSPEKGGVD